MTIRQLMSSMSDEQVEQVADKICDLMYETVEAYNRNHDYSFCGEPCEICPFTKYCKVGETGFITFLSEEVEPIINK